LGRRREPRAHRVRIEQLLDAEGAGCAARSPAFRRPPLDALTLSQRARAASSS